MSESAKLLIAMLFCLVGFVVFGYELVRRSQTEITKGKLLSLGLVGCWMVLLAIYLGVCGGPGDARQALGAVLIPLLPLGLIWFGDELGELTGFRMGLVQRRSPEFLVRLIGWIFLLIVVGGSGVGMALDVWNAWRG